MTLNIYFIRHGKTIFNDYGRMQGWCDTPLLDSSINEAITLGNNLRTLNIDALFSSDSGRAIQTRDGIIEGLQFQGPKHIETNVREFFFGTAEGLNVIDYWDDVVKDHGYQKLSDLGPEITMLDRLDWIHTFDNNTDAESSAQFEMRIRAGLDSIIKTAHDNNYKNICVVTHGVTLAQLIAFGSEDAVFYTSPDNLSVNKMVVEDGHESIEYVNNTTFLVKETL